MLQTPSILGATLSFKQYSSPCLLPGMRQDMREHQRLDYYSSLLAIAHDSVFSEISLTQNKGARVLSSSVNLRHPPGFMPPTSRRGTLYQVQDAHIFNITRNNTANVSIRQQTQNERNTSGSAPDFARCAGHSSSSSGSCAFVYTPVLLLLFRMLLLLLVFRVQRCRKSGWRLKKKCICYSSLQQYEYVKKRGLFFDAGQLFSPELLPGTILNRTNIVGRNT